MSEEPVLPIPNLNVPQCLFGLSNPSLKHLHDKARKELLEGVKADGASLFPYEPPLI
jgi:26S proteasome regulatory subunit N7